MLPLQIQSYIDIVLIQVGGWHCKADSQSTAAMSNVWQLCAFQFTMAAAFQSI